MAHRLHNPDDRMLLPRGYTDTAPGGAHQLWLPRGIAIDIPSTPTPGDQPAGTAQSYVISGAGTAGANGTVTYYASSYLWGGSLWHVWQEAADNPQLAMLRVDRDGSVVEWSILASLGDSVYAVYTITGDNTNPPAAGWTVTSVGTAPAPTVAAAT